MNDTLDLPESAEAVKPVELKIGNWVMMTMDAKLVYKGITWYRAQNGFSNRGDREDWVADLPEVSLHVGRYLHRPRAGWAAYRGTAAAEDTMLAAMDVAISHHVRWTTEKIAKAEKQLRDLRRSLVKLQLAAQ